MTTSFSSTYAPNPARRHSRGRRGKDTAGISDLQNEFEEASAASDWHARREIAHDVQQRKQKEHSEKMFRLKGLGHHHDVEGEGRAEFRSELAMRARVRRDPRSLRIGMATQPLVSSTAPPAAPRVVPPTQRRPRKPVDSLKLKSIVARFKRTGETPRGVSLIQIDESDQTDVDKRTLKRMKTAMRLELVRAGIEQNPGPENFVVPSREKFGKYFFAGTVDKVSCPHVGTFAPCEVTGKPKSAMQRWFCRSCGRLLYVGNTSRLAKCDPEPMCYHFSCAEYPYPQYLAPSESALRTGLDMGPSAILPPMFLLPDDAAPAALPSNDKGKAPVVEHRLSVVRPTPPPCAPTSDLQLASRMSSSRHECATAPVSSVQLPDAGQSARVAVQAAEANSSASLATAPAAPIVEVVSPCVHVEQGPTASSPEMLDDQTVLRGHVISNIDAAEILSSLEGRKISVDGVRESVHIVQYVTERRIAPNRNVVEIKQPLEIRVWHCHKDFVKIPKWPLIFPLISLLCVAALFIHDWQVGEMIVISPFHLWSMAFDAPVNCRWATMSYIFHVAFHLRTFAFNFPIVVSPMTVNCFVQFVTLVFMLCRVRVLYTGKDVNLTYVPHLVSSVWNDYDRTTSLQAAKESMRQKIRRCAALPLPDVDHVKLVFGTEMVIDQVLASPDFLTPCAVVGRS